MDTVTDKMVTAYLEAWHSDCISWGCCDIYKSTVKRCLEAAMKAQAETPAEWIKHKGENLPIDRCDTMVVAANKNIEAKLRDGTIKKLGLAGKIKWSWDKMYPEFDIVEFRILPQEDKPEAYEEAYKKTHKMLHKVHNDDLLTQVGDCNMMCNARRVTGGHIQGCAALEEDKPEPKKQYKLSEMWKVWYRHEITYGVDVEHLNCMFALSKAEAQVIAEQMKYNDDSVPVAITRADAQEFYEGQGL